MTTQNETEDPVIAEVRKTRRRLLQEHGGVAGLASFLRRAEKESNWPNAETRAGARPQAANGGEAWKGIVGSQKDNPLFDEVMAVIQAERAAERAAMALIDDNPADDH